MAERIYKLGTNSGKWKNVTSAELFASDKWTNLDPEFARRIFAMLNLLIDFGGSAGLGATYRSYESQRSTFLSRYHGVSGPSKKSVAWKGTDNRGVSYSFWEKNPGETSIAPPGMSYHDLVTSQGKCLAVDLMGYQSDRNLMQAYAPWFGLYMTWWDLSDPHHFQPIEVPHAKKYYNPKIHKLSYWSFKF
jgi:hypothetical protein